MSKQHPTIVELDTLADQAAIWFQRLSDVEVSPDTEVEFERWIRANPAHKAAYQEYASIWHHPELDAVLQDFAEPEKTRPKPTRMMQWIAAAAVILAVPILAFISTDDEPMQAAHQVLAFQTAVGEIRKVSLPDGSTVELNTDTSVKITFGEERHVLLQQGEAYFNVERDGRPFVVDGGTGRITVLGTAFNARVKYNQMVVAVDHGSVSVGSRAGGSRTKTLEQNDTLAVTDYRLGSIRSSETEVADWRDGWLDITDASLQEVVRELDRYHPGEIRLASNELWRFRVTGRFDLSDIERATKVLGKSLRLQVTISGDSEIVISKPQ